MIKRTLIGLLAVLLNIDAFAISYSDAQQLLNKLNGKPLKLGVTNEKHLNAYGGAGRVAVTRGMLKAGNQAVFIFVLAHEIAHARGMASEVGADQTSVKIARKAGLDVCPGARQFLLTAGKKGGGVHPDGIIRLKRMGCA